ncbi:zinc finger matrin-type protein 4 isoform 3-T3 [Pluvialis apricaria]
MRLCCWLWHEHVQSICKTQTTSSGMAEMKSSDIDQELFTESYCKVCSAQLISESQRVAHYEGSDGDSVDKNKCCTLCNMSFTSAVVAESHYQGKIHAKRLKLLLGEQPALKATETTLSSLKQPHTDSPPVVPSPHQRRDSDRYCQLCAAWFNNPMMAQQHYDGKKHKKNAARADLLEQLGKTLDLGELRGLKRSYTCNICSVTLNSIEQYHAHLKGSKHQTNSREQLNNYTAYEERVCNTFSHYRIKLSLFPFNVSENKDI